MAPGKMFIYRAFTLTEVMVAVLIIGMIGTLTYGVFGNTLTVRDRAMEVGLRYHEVRQGMKRMSREISMAYLSRHYNCQDRRTTTIFQKKESGGSDSLLFSSFSHIKMREDANESDQNIIHYFVEQDPKDRTVKSLMRREKNRIDDEPERGGKVQVLIPNIKELKFEFYNEKQDDWVDDWDTEHSDNRQQLPLYVKITVEVEGAGRSKEVFTTKTQVYLHSTDFVDGLLISGTGFTACPE
jgi:general secretion pathway protein J